METVRPSLQSGASPEHAGKQAPRRLQGRTLRAAHLLFGVFFVVCLAIFAISLWHIFERGTLPCEAPLNSVWELSACQDFRAAQVEVSLSALSFEIYFLTLRIIAAVPYLAISLLLLRRRPSELRVLALAAFLVLLGTAGTAFNPLWEWAGGWFADFSPYPALEWVTIVLSFLFFGLGINLFYAFPDGRFVPRHTRWLAVIWLLLQVPVRFFPESPLSYTEWPRPLDALLPFGLLASAVAAIFYRYRRVASAGQRRQIKWVVVGLSLLMTVMALDVAVWSVYPSLTGQDLITTGRQAVTWELFQDTGWYAAQFTLTICLAFALFRRNLWDVDLVISRALVYLGLTAIIIALYAGIVGALGALFQSRGSFLFSLLATGVVAVLFQPLRQGLQRRVSRLIYGERDDPVAVLSAMGEELAQATTADVLLPGMVRRLAETLKLPYVAVQVRSGESAEVVAAWGEPVTEVEALPLIFQSEEVGCLQVAPRGPGEKFSIDEQMLLQNIARQAGAAAHTVRLTNALRRSRQAIVTAREEERRRLRRDLHDGLGPQLASQTLGLDAAVKLMERNPAEAVALVQELKRQSTEAILDIRRLVHNLRPPALDDLGLLGALRASAPRLVGEGVALDFDFPAELPELPAAVEVAAYRIAQEALTNVGRHAGARHCRVSLRLNGQSLELEVADDGQGLPAEAKSGVGLQSMRERAAELTGICRIESSPGQGSRVRVSLPW